MLRVALRSEVFTRTCRLEVCRAFDKVADGPLAAVVALDCRRSVAMEMLKDDSGRVWVVTDVEMCDAR